MGAGWQRWWRDTLVLEEPVHTLGKEPHADDDCFIAKFRSYVAVAPTPWWYCTGCWTISCADFHCCHTNPRYTIDLRGLF